MTDFDAIDVDPADLDAWVAEMRHTFQEIAEVSGAPQGVLRDPDSALGFLQQWVDRQPLSDFQESDWVTLHNDLTAYAAAAMIHDLGASWQVRPDASAPTGHRYLLRVTDGEGDVHYADPFAVVARELQERPIEVARILASAKLTLGVPEIE